MNVYFGKQVLLSLRRQIESSLKREQVNVFKFTSTRFYFNTNCKVHTLISHGIEKVLIFSVQCQYFSIITFDRYCETLLVVGDLENSHFEFIILTIFQCSIINFRALQFRNLSFIYKQQIIKSIITGLESGIEFIMKFGNFIL